MKQKNITEDIKTLACIWDLETTDNKPHGQIMEIGYAFVDEDFEIIESKNIPVRLTKWHIPHPEALLTTKFDVATHNSNKDIRTERQAFSDFESRIEHYQSEGYTILLAGQNINKFDLEFLRSNRLRNGMDMFGVYRLCNLTDLMFLSKKLLVCSEEFRELMRTPEGGWSISLQNIIKKTGIFDGKQSHRALDDVMWTLEVFKLYKEKYGLNFFEYKPYEPSKYTVDWGDVFYNYTVELKKGIISKNRVFSHFENKNYTLWGNYDNFVPEKGKENLRWYKKDGKSFITSHKLDGSLDARVLSKDPIALKYSEDSNIVSVDTNNYFTDPDCDVELHPTKVNIFLTRSVLAVMHTNGEDPIAWDHLEIDANERNLSAQQKLSILTFIERYRIHKMTNIELLNDTDKELLIEYLTDRYKVGLKLKTWDIREEGIDSTHAPQKQRTDTLKEMVTLAKDKYLKFVADGNKADALILKNWLKYVDQHDIIKLIPDILK